MKLKKRNFKNKNFQKKFQNFFFNFGLKKITREYKLLKTKF